MSDKKTPNPWDSKKSGRSGRRKAPSSKKSSGNGEDVIVDLIRRGVERQQKNGRSQRSNGSGGGNGGGTPPPIFANIPPKRLFIYAALVVVALWLVSGVYRVLPEEHAVVQRFGAYQTTIEKQGLHYHLPWPIETVTKPNVTFERRIEIGYRDPSGGRASRLAMQDRPDESMMLTGDANIVDINFVVQWKIGSARDYLFNIRDAEGTIKRVAESAMREVIGQNKLQSIITEGRENVATRVRGIMQEMLDDYGSGVAITQVLVQDATVPQPVMDAFEDVIRADQDAETLRNQALKYQNDIIPKARGEAIQLRLQAESYAEEVVNRAEGEAQRFRDVYDSYSQAKDVTRKRLYLQTIEEILANNQTIIIDQEDGAGGVLPYLPLNNRGTPPSDGSRN